jgi:hypothetical protein
MVAQAVSPALPILDDFCHGLLAQVRHDNGNFDFFAPPE